MPNTSIYNGHVIPHAKVINDEIYLYGTTKQMFGSATNRFPFVHKF